jgi:hypothetical protein
LDKENALEHSATSIDARKIIGSCGKRSGHIFFVYNTRVDCVTIVARDLLFDRGKSGQQLFIHTSIPYIFQFRDVGILSLVKIVIRNSISRYRHTNNKEPVSRTMHVERIHLFKKFCFGYFITALTLHSVRIRFIC